MLDVEVFGHELTHDFRGGEDFRGGVRKGMGDRAASSIPSPSEIERLCACALASAGIEDGHLAVEFVSAERIAELNAVHRGKEGPTDVLSFPIDELESPASTEEGGDGAGTPRELGDIVICPDHTVDLREAVVHGALHLLGMDHETDDGEMLALQDRIMQEQVS